MTIGCRRRRAARETARPSGARRRRRRLRWRSGWNRCRRRRWCTPRLGRLRRRRRQRIRSETRWSPSSARPNRDPRARTRARRTRRHPWCTRSTNRSNRLRSRKMTEWISLTIWITPRRRMKARWACSAHRLHPVSRMFQRIRTCRRFHTRRLPPWRLTCTRTKSLKRRKIFRINRSRRFTRNRTRRRTSTRRRNLSPGVIFLNKRHSLWRNRCTNPRCLLLRRQRRRYRLLLRLLPRRRLRLHLLRLRRRRRKVFRTPPHTSQWHPFILKNMLRRRNSRSKLSTSRSRW